MYGWIIAAVSAMVGALVVNHFWDQIRDEVAAWLRAHNLAKSALMDAWIKLDSLVGSVRCALFVKTRDAREVKISETVYTPDQITDPQIQEELRKKHSAKRSVMHLIQ
jgi:hypothetical protein